MANLTGDAIFGPCMVEFPIMNIESAKVDELTRRLARLTGEDVETALERAIEERLAGVAVTARSDRRSAMQRFFDRVSQKQWAMARDDRRGARLRLGAEGLLAAWPKLLHWRKVGRSDVKNANKINRRFCAFSLKAAQCNRASLAPRKRSGPYAWYVI